MEYASGLPEHMDIGFRVAERSTEDAVEYLRDLARTMKDGDTIDLIVPDFDHTVAIYANQSGGAEQHAVDGGRFKSIWNRTKLVRALDACGFGVTGPASGTSWTEGGYIRIRARKYARPTPPRPMKDIGAIMSLPRIAWTTTMGCLHESAASRGIDVTRTTGVFWGQCMQRMVEAAVAEGRKYILTVDYDSVFDENDIVRLWQIMESNPDVAVLCPLQIQRDKENSLVCIQGPDGKLARGISEEQLHCEAIDIYTGHFGLTLIRVAALEGVARPLFWGQPDAQGGWGSGRVDDDIQFWNQMRKAGRRICLCPRVRIGHLQLVVTWPDERFEAVHQYHPQYTDEGRPPCTLTF